MKKHYVAAVLTAAGLAGFVQESQACGEPPQNRDMIVDLTMVPHKSILPIEQKKVLSNGNTTIMTKDDTWSEKTVTFRCPVPTSYEFQINDGLLETALNSQEAVHISLDTNYDAGKNDLRGCVNIPVINVKIEEGETSDLSKVFFTLNETSDQMVARKQFIDIVDPTNRNNETWCYTVQLN